MLQGTVKLTHCVGEHCQYLMCTPHAVGHCETHILCVGTLPVYVGAYHMLWGTEKLTHCVCGNTVSICRCTPHAVGHYETHIL